MHVCRVSCTFFLEITELLTRRVEYMFNPTTDEQMGILFAIINDFSIEPIVQFTCVYAHVDRWISQDASEQSDRIAVFEKSPSQTLALDARFKKLDNLRMQGSRRGQRIDQLVLTDFFLIRKPSVNPNVLANLLATSILRLVVLVIVSKVCRVIPLLKYLFFLATDKRATHAPSGSALRRSKRASPPPALLAACSRAPKNHENEST